jgi:Transposase, Mutator family
VSVRRVEDITEALWGTRVSPSTVSNPNKKIYASIEMWRMRPIDGEQPYIYLDGIVLKRTWAGQVRNVSLLVATSVNAEGYREILKQSNIATAFTRCRSPWARERVAMFPNLPACCALSPLACAATCSCRRAADNARGRSVDAILSPTRCAGF